MLFVEFKAAVKPSLRFFAVCKTYTVSAGFKEFKFMRYTVFAKRVAQHYAVIVIDRTVILARPDKRRRKAPVCKLFNARSINLGLAGKQSEKIPARYLMSFFAHGYERIAEHKGFGG